MASMQICVEKIPELKYFIEVCNAKQHISGAVIWRLTEHLKQDFTNQ